MNISTLYLFEINFLFGSVLAFLVGLIVFLKNKTSIVSHTFFLLSFSGALWSFGFFFMLNAPSYKEAYIWRLIMDIGAILIPAFWMHFVQAITGELNKKILFWFYLIAAGIASLNILEYLYPGIFINRLEQKLVFDYYPTAGPGYYLLISFYFIAIPYSLNFLKKIIKRSEGMNALQLKFIFIAALAGFAGGSMAFLPTFDILVLPVGVALFSIYPVIIAFAILRHQLFNIKVIATEAIVFALWVFLLIRLTLANNVRDRVIEGGLLTVVIIFGILLIRSVLHEVRQREEISHLAQGLKKANLELKKLDQLKTEFMSLATHQMRSPLTVIKGYISMVLEGSFGELPEKIKSVLNKVYISNEHLINLINDFLNLSRIESGRMHYNFESADASLLVEAAVEEFKGLALEKNLELSFEKPAESLPAVKVDKEKFHQVIANLIDNAIKYTSEGAIKAGLKADGKNVLIYVKDTGIGMTSKELDSIFQRFSRGEVGSKVFRGGLGLGLYLAKKIIEDHGGEIWAESKGRGQGSSFFIRLGIW